MREQALLKQHSVESIKNALNGIFTFSQIKHGNIKKGEGDVVIINIKVNDELKDHVTLENYLSYTRFIDRIETNGIYTNIFFGKELYNLMNKHILLTI